MSAIRPILRVCIGLLAAAIVNAGMVSAEAEAEATSGATDVLRGEAAEKFLRKARILQLSTLKTGVTQSQRATLSDGDREARAVWKVIDEYAPVKDFHDGGPVELGFRDSYKHEIASYELAKLLGLDLVPPTVERRNRGTRGSLQLWIEDAVTEADRRKDPSRRPPDPVLWNQQIYNVRLLRQLTHDMDFNNTLNLLVDADYNVWAIDFSRAFRTHEKLLAESDLERFSRSVLEQLSALDEAALDQQLGKWLTKRQQRALLARRDLILETADRRIEEFGEDAVLFE